MTPTADDLINRERIASTEPIIRPHIRRTPTIDIDGSDLGLAPIRLSIKLELLQHSGSFKARGAFTNLLTRELPPAGVAAASGGNHGAAVAYAAMKLGLHAKIFVPAIASPAKIQRLRDYGADLVLTDGLYAEALAACDAWLPESGALLVHAFDQVETLLGQGTVGLELEEQHPDLDTVLVAVGGGGLIGGIAAWYAGRARIVAVEPEGAPTLFAALAAGAPVDTAAGSIAADSLAPRRVGELVYPLAVRYVEKVVLVTDDEIRAAQETLWRLLRVVAEPGGATAFAAVSSGRYEAAPGERVGIVVSGGNTVAVDFNRG